MKYIKLYEDIEWEFDEEEQESINPLSSLENYYIKYNTKQECIDIMNKLVQLGFIVYDYGYYDDYYKWGGFIYEHYGKSHQWWIQTILTPGETTLEVLSYDDIKNL